MQKCANPQGRDIFAYRNAQLLLQAIGPQHLETLDWLPPMKLGGGEDELHQATMRCPEPLSPKSTSGISEQPY